MATERYFQNDMALGPELDGAEVDREILKAAAVALKEVKACAIKHADVSGGSIYVGLGGVGLTYLRMAQQVQRGFRYEHAAYLQKHTVSHSLQLAGQFLGEAEKLMSQKRVTFLEGASGVLACLAVLAHMNGDADTLHRLVQELVGLWSSRIQGVCADGECELLYGRAGYLYSLTWLQQQLGRDTVPQDLIKAVVQHILDEGMRGAAELQQQQDQQATGGRPQASWGLMYAWHGKRYLGAAHGVAGILYVLLHHMGTIRQLDSEAAAAAGAGSAAAAAGGGTAAAGGKGSPRNGSSAGSPSRFSGIGRSNGPYMTAVLAALDALVAAQFPSGNLPTKLGDREDTRVAWCHGASGLVLTLLKATQTVGDPQGRYMSAARAAADDIWQRGLLRKGVGLCHGISGNGYALLALARTTGQPHYLRAARGFALYAAQHWRELYDVPDRPASLFEGLAGAVNFWLDVVDPQHSKWPGAEL